MIRPDGPVNFHGDLRLHLNLNLLFTIHSGGLLGFRRLLAGNGLQGAFLDRREQGMRFEIRKVLLDDGQHPGAVARGYDGRMMASFGGPDFRMRALRQSPVWEPFPSCRFGGDLDLMVSELQDVSWLDELQICDRCTPYVVGVRCDLSKSRRPLGARFLAPRRPRRNTPCRPP